jgi:hypothetical protein
MIGKILPNNNERCYNNFSPTFHEVNTPFIFFLNTTLYTKSNKLGITSNGSTNLEIWNLQNSIQIYENNKRKNKKTKKQKA